MNIDKALAELRAAFPGVTWGRTPDGWCICSDAVLVYSPEDGAAPWACRERFSIEGSHPGLTPVSAVRAWLSAQPTAAFYPEAPTAALTECRGTLVMYAAGAWGMAGFSDTGDGDTARRHAFLLAEADPRASGAWTEYPVVVRVPVPVEPPVLVGEVVP